jgi:hypothetical protein
MFLSYFSFRVLILHSWQLQVFTVEVTGSQAVSKCGFTDSQKCHPSGVCSFPCYPWFRHWRLSWRMPVCLLCVCEQQEQVVSRRCKIHGLTIHVHALAPLQHNTQMHLAIIGPMQGLFKGCTCKAFSSHSCIARLRLDDGNASYFSWNSYLRVC